MACLCPQCAGIEPRKGLDRFRVLPFAVSQSFPMLLGKNQGQTYSPRNSPRIDHVCLFKRKGLSP